MLQQFGAIGIFLIFGIIFGLGALIASFLLRPKKPTPLKDTTYECGIPTIGDTWVQFKTSYFLYALIFLVFDIETVFLYPWAVKFQSLGLFAIIEMFIFIAILVIGFWYAWKEGALEWK